MILIDFDLWRKSPARVSKLISTCSEQNFDKKLSFRKIYNCFISLDFKCEKWCFVVGLFITSGHWAEILRFSGKGKFGSFIKFEENVVFWKKHNVSLFFGFSAWKFLIMDGKILVALLELNSTCLASVLRKLDLLNILLHLWGCERKEGGLLVKKIPAGLLELHYMIREDHFVMRYTFWKDIFLKVNSWSWV